MPEENKDRLEEFFRKHTERYQFEYNDADWKKLEAKLDEVDRKGGVVPPSRNNGFRYFLFGGLLILGLAVYFSLTTLFGNEDRQSAAHLSEELRQKTDAADNFSEGSVTLSDHPQTSETQEFKEETTNAETGAYQGSSSGAEDVVSRDESNSRPSGYGDPGTFSSAQYAGGEDPSAVDDRHKAEDTGNFLTGSSPEDIDEDSPHQPFEFRGDGAQRIASYGVYLQSGQGSLAKVQFQRHDLQSPSGEDIIDKEKQAQTISRSAFASFTVAPDFSTVGIGDYTRPGTRYGLTAGYYLSRRLIISSGAILVNNVYTAEGDEYNAVSGFWQDGTLPIAAEGECRIVDIPLNLRYNIIARNSGNLFISGGVTSYIMLKEKYQFSFDESEYEYGNNGAYGNKDSWESKNTSAHWFGLINISAGYERFVAKNWSVQAEPFVNFPITGIGWGKVDLYSMGAYLSIKYHWNKK